MNMTEKFEMVPPSALIPSPTNARVHTERQLRYLRGSLREFGFVSPVVVDADNNIIAGHAMVEVAIAEGLPQVPCVRAEHLTDTQRRAYMIADNRLAEMATGIRNCCRRACRACLKTALIYQSPALGNTNLRMPWQKKARP